MIQSFSIYVGVIKMSNNNPVHPSFFPAFQTFRMIIDPVRERDVDRRVDHFYRDNRDGRDCIDGRFLNSDRTYLVGRVQYDSDRYRAIGPQARGDGWDYCGRDPRDRDRDCRSDCDSRVDQERDRERIEQQRSRGINKIITSPGTYKKILSICKIYLNQLNDINIVTAFHCIASRIYTQEDRSKLPRDPDFCTLKEKAKEIIASFEAGSLATISRAFAILRIKDRDLFSRIAETTTIDKLQTFDARAYANLAWAFATLGFENRTLFSRIAVTVTKEKLQSFEAQELVNFTWAFVTLGSKDLALFDRIFVVVTQDSLNRLKDFTAQNFAIFARAFATYGEINGIKYQTLFKRIAQAVTEEKLQTFEAQDYANLTWAFAILGNKDDALFVRIADSITKENLQRFNAQELANLAWAFAILGSKNQALFDRIADAVRNEKLQTFEAQDYAHLTWAFAVLRIKNQALFERIAQAVTKEKLESFKAQELVNFTWAFAVLKITNIALFDRIDAVTLNIRNFSTQNLHILSWAFEALGSKKRALAERIAREALIDKLYSH